MPKRKHLQPTDNTSPIRIIGDPVLHNKGKIFQNQPNESEFLELKNQINIAKKLLISTGGAGIAANQCAAIKSPYQMIIVGVYHDNKTHVENVEKRYPGVKFPDATLMINPKIIDSSEETMVFSHGCLSVPGQIRGEIKTPVEITVEYQTINSQDQMVTARKTADGMDTVVLQHELNHILFGKTYVDCCLSDISSHDLKTLYHSLLNEKKNRKLHNDHSQKLNDDFFPFVQIDMSGISRLDVTSLELALRRCISKATLQGLIARVKHHLICNPRL